MIKIGRFEKGKRLINAIYCKMSDKTKLFIGILLIVIGQLLTFRLWFDGQNIDGANGFSKIILFSSLMFGLIFIIKSFNPSRFDTYVYFMALPVLIYYFYPNLMNAYKLHQLSGMTSTTNAYITKIDDHYYGKYHSRKKYYEFQTTISNQILVKFKEDVIEIADWKLKIGDTIQIKYAHDDINLIEVVE